MKLTEKIKLKDLPFIETMTVTSSKPTLPEYTEDDMKRELAFYQQALEAAHIGRAKILEAGVPFSRPDDYFAEMVKSDEHMAKVRQRLLNQNARIKASEDAKRQRDLKKFGKKVQVQRQLERQKEKSETLDKIKQLKRSKYTHLMRRVSRELTCCLQSGKKAVVTLLWMTTLMWR